MPSKHDSTYVNGGQLVLFDAALDETDRQDILHSSLLAQMVANKFIQTHPIAGWPGQYAQTLRKLDWLEVQSQSWPLVPAAQPGKTLAEVFASLAERFPWLAALTNTLVRLGAQGQQAGTDASRILRTELFKTQPGKNTGDIHLELSSVVGKRRLRFVSLTVPGIDTLTLDDPLTHTFAGDDPSKPITLRAGVIELLDSYARHRLQVASKLGDALRRLTLQL